MGVREKRAHMATKQCLKVECDSGTEMKIAMYQSNTEGNDRCIMQTRVIRL